MRLIDADAIDRNTFVKAVGENGGFISFGDCLEMLKNQPTAYDVDAVVEQLEEKGDLIHFIDNSQCIRVDDAIEIVKAKDILEAYEKSQQIQVGDVIYADDEPDSFGVVTYKDSKVIYVLWDDGSSDYETAEDFHKTGRHIDISNLLEQIRGDD